MTTHVAASATRVFIACTACKSRKRRCNGQKPVCSNCASLGRECNYAHVRKTRGPGRERGKKPVAKGDTSAGNEQITPSQVQIAWVPFLPDFLTEGFAQQVRDVKKTISTGFTPLLPQELAVRLFHTSCTQVLPHGLLDVTDALFLLHEQYVTSNAGPAGNAARWALVSAIIALCVRYKTAAGAESEIGPIANAFYRNATGVLQRIVSEPPTLLTVRAFLVMAKCAEVTDPLFGTLMENALRQLELLEGGDDADDVRRVRAVARSMARSGQGIKIS